MRRVRVILGSCGSSLSFAAMLVVAVLVPAQAQAFKPDIVYVRATEDNEGITFTVKVRMDKGGRDERKVSVTYEGERKQAPVARTAAAVSLRDEGLLDPVAQLLSGQDRRPQPVRDDDQEHARQPDRHQRLRLGRGVRVEVRRHRQAAGLALRRRVVAEREDPRERAERLVAGVELLDL